MALFFSDRITWKTSTRSAKGVNCVEVATLPGFIGLRDTKDRPAGYLSVDRPAFNSFLAAIKKDY